MANLCYSQLLCLQVDVCLMRCHCSCLENARSWPMFRQNLPGKSNCMWLLTSWGISASSFICIFFLCPLLLCVQDLLLFWWKFLEVRYSVLLGLPALWKEPGYSLPLCLVLWQILHCLWQQAVLSSDPWLALPAVWTVFCTSSISNIFIKYISIKTLSWQLLLLFLLFYKWGNAWGNNSVRTANTASSCACTCSRNTCNRNEE